jgi:hypothetical protein
MSPGLSGPESMLVDPQGTNFRFELALRGLSGLFSVAIGLFVVYENGVLNRLLA